MRIVGLGVRLRADWRSKNEFLGRASLDGDCDCGWDNPFCSLSLRGDRGGARIRTLFCSEESRIGGGAICDWIWA